MEGVLYNVETLLRENDVSCSTGLCDHPMRNVTYLMAGSSFAKFLPTLQSDGAYWTRRLDRRILCWQVGEEREITW
jgi:hypothetical protein